MISFKDSYIELIKTKMDAQNITFHRYEPRRIYSKTK